MFTPVRTKGCMGMGWVPKPPLSGAFSWKFALSDGLKEKPKFRAVAWLISTTCASRTTWRLGRSRA
ncbi:hypothetical protein D3C87_2083110 [compost metagenome]